LNNILLVQNVISRVTHGLLGLDIYEQEKSRNQYLEDFLTLDIEEVQIALIPKVPRALVPTESSVSLEDFAVLIQNIAKAKKTIKNIENEKPEAIKETIKGLKKTVLLLYGAYSR